MERRLAYEIRALVAVYVTLPSVAQDYAVTQLLLEPSYKSNFTDLKNLRLVNRAFAKVVPEQLYSEVIVIPDAASIERLRLVCEHPTYSRYVKTLHYKSNVAQTSSDPDNPTNLDDHPPGLFNGTEDWTGHSPPWGICWLHPVHPIYEDTGNDIWQFGYDACTVAMLLGRIPRLEKMTVKKIMCKGCRCEENLSPQSRTLISGAYNAGTNLRHLECHFNLEQVAQLQPLESSRFGAIFSNLRKLRLTLYLDTFPQLELHDGHNYLSDFISQATNLRSLAVSVEVGGGVDLNLSALVGECVWPHLEEFAFGDNFTMEENDLINFASRHVDTLKILSLGDILLTGGGSWNSTLARLRSTVQLNEFHSTSVWSRLRASFLRNRDVLPSTRDWRVQAYDLTPEGQAVKAEGYDLAMAIRTYVLHGGSFDIEQWPFINLG